MKAVKAILAVFFLILGLAGFALCVAGVVGIWAVKKPLANWTEHLVGQADKSLGIAVRSISQLNKSLERARTSLDSIREAAGEPGKDIKDPVVKKVLARMVASELGPRIGGARETVEVVTQASVVLNSVLKDLLANPKAATALDTGRLHEVSEGLGATARAAEELTGLLDDNQTGAKEKAEAVRGRTSFIAEALDHITALLGKFLTQVTDVRAEVAKLTPKVGPWIDLGVIVLTVALIWIAAGQLCLLALGWRWLRTPSSKTTGAVP